MPSCKNILHAYTRNCIFDVFPYHGSVILCPSFHEHVIAVYILQFPFKKYLWIKSSISKLKVKINCIGFCISVQKLYSWFKIFCDNKNIVIPKLSGDYQHILIVVFKNSFSCVMHFPKCSLSVFQLITPKNMKAISHT